MKPQHILPKALTKLETEPIIAKNRSFLINVKPNVLDLKSIKIRKLKHKLFELYSLYNRFLAGLGRL
jgi:hypothetical protein